MADQVVKFKMTIDDKDALNSLDNLNSKGEEVDSTLNGISDKTINVTAVDNASESIDEVATNLDVIPEEVDTLLIATDEASDLVAEVQSGVDDLDGASAETELVVVDNASAEIGNVASGVESLPDGKTIAVDVDVNDQDIQNTTAAVAALGVAAIAAGNATKEKIDETVAAYKIQETAELKLETITRSRLDASDDEIQSIENLASAEQELGVIGDEVQLAGAAQIAMYTEETKSIEALMPAMNDLNASKYGYETTAQNAVSTSRAFGKALDGETSMLERQGVQFSDTQKEILKYGTEEEKVAALTDAVNTSVGDMNEQLAATDIGAMKQLENTMGDLGEQIGAELAPALADLAVKIGSIVIPAMEAFVAFLDANPWAAKMIVMIALLLPIIGVLIVSLAGVPLVITAITSAIGTVGAAFALLTGPVLVVVAVITLIVLAFRQAWLESEVLRTVVNEVMANVAMIIQLTCEIIKAVWTLMVVTLGALWAVFGGFITRVFIIVFKVLKMVLDWFVIFFQIVLAILQGDWAGAWEACKLLFATFSEDIKVICEWLIYVALPAIWQWFVYTFIPWFVKAIIALIQNMIDWIVTWNNWLINTALPGVWNWFVHTFLPWFVQFVINLIKGLVTGIINLMETLIFTTLPAVWETFIHSFLPWFFGEFLAGIAQLCADTLVYFATLAQNIIAELMDVVTFWNNNNDFSLPTMGGGNKVAPTSAKGVKSGGGAKFGGEYTPTSQFERDLNSITRNSAPVGNGTGGQINSTNLNLNLEFNGSMTDRDINRIIEIAVNKADQLLGRS